MRLLPRLSAILAAVLLALSLTGCGTDEPVDVLGNWDLVGAQLTDGRWQAEDGGRYFLQIQEGTDADGAEVVVARGIAGCHEFQARVEHDGGDFSFEDFEAVTRESCPESLPDPMGGSYLTALEDLDAAERDGDTLILRGPEDVGLTFERRG